MNVTGLWCLYSKLDNVFTIGASSLIIQTTLVNGAGKSTGAGCNELVQTKLRTGVSKKGKTYTSFHYRSLINVCVLFLSPGTQYRGSSVAGYGFITHHVIYFMG